MVPTIFRNSIMPTLGVSTPDFLLRITAVLVSAIFSFIFLKLITAEWTMLMIKFTTLIMYSFFLI